MSNRLRIAPGLTILLLFFVVTGRFVDYTIVVLSLIAHEVGHIAAAKFVNAPIAMIRLHLYGGEITFKPVYISVKKQLIIALGGPFVTLFILLLCSQTNFLITPYIMNVQQWILFINLLPIWPLDGGRILIYSWSFFINAHFNNKRYLLGSFISSIFLSILAVIFNMPFLALLFIFISLQTWRDYKDWSLKNAFETIVLTNG